MAAYILHTTAISAQNTFDSENYLREKVLQESDFLIVTQPSYRTILDPRKSRRMAKIIKMSTACALNCLNETENLPEAIIVGTGLGCLSDTEKFLDDVVQNKEEIIIPHRIHSINS